MRTTLNIDDYILRQIKEEAHRSGRPLKKVVNEALREGLEQLQRPVPTIPYKCKTYAKGYPPRIDFDKALELAAALEDMEITRKLKLRK